MKRKIEFASLEYHNDNYLYPDGENQMARTTVEQQESKRQNTNLDRPRQSAGVGGCAQEGRQA
jgi:hypothetical protein